MVSPDTANIVEHESAII